MTRAARASERNGPSIHAWRTRPALGGALLWAALVTVLTLPAFDTAHAVTFTVTSASTEGDFDGGDGACATEMGVCTWGAVQGEVQGSVHKVFVIQFAPNVTAVPAGQFFAPSAGLDYDITIQGPITIDMGLAPVRTRGLHFRDVDTIHLDGVWIKGTGSIADGFNTADTGFVSTTLSPSTCTIANSHVTGVHVPLDLGTPTTPIRCHLTDNVIGIAPDDSLIGNGRGLVLYGDFWVLERNVLAGSGPGRAIEIWDEFNQILDNEFGAKGPIAFGNAGSVYVLGDRNLFDGNTISNSGGRGIEIRGDRNVLIKNRIGTDSSGTLEMGNFLEGLHIRGNDNCVGADLASPTGCDASDRTALAAQANIVSGNAEDGIYVFGDRNELYESFVGTSDFGVLPIPNRKNGIYVNSSAVDTVIDGGTIAGNLDSGIHLQETSGVLISGVEIGTNGVDEANIGNELHGIHLVSSTDVFIGDSFTPSPTNVISGNHEDGIRIEGSNGTVSGVVVFGNWIGLGPNEQSVGNRSNGITIFNSVSDVLLIENVISANRGHGIQLRSADVTVSSKVRNVSILRNYIGTSPPKGDPSVLPLMSRGNLKTGVHVTDLSPLTNRGAYRIDIGEPGDTGSGARFGNVIAGNVESGIWVEHTDSRADRDTVNIQGNFIGVDESMHPIANGDSGVLLGAGAFTVLVGGENGGGTDAGNVISGNVRHGVRVLASDAEIKGNFIGTDASGNIRGPANEWLGLQNGQNGIELVGGSLNVIGGTAAAGNFISGNGWNGIQLNGDRGSEISFNAIGFTSGNGFVQDIGNVANGIYADNGARAEIRQNLIAFNFAHGVHLFGTSTNSNWITKNSIFSNAQKGIHLSGGANNGQAPPFNTTVTLAQVEGSTCPGCTVEIFSDDGDEGGIFEGQVVADGLGQFVLAQSFQGPNISCTTFPSSDPLMDRSTSEFGCQSIDPPLLQDLSLEKSVADPNGDVVAPGDVLAYQIDVHNDTQYDFTDVGLFDDLKDIIPQRSTYVSESLIVDLVPNDDDLSDQIGFDAAANAIVWNGDLPSSGTLSIHFEVTVDDDTEPNTLISNQAQMILGTTALPTLATSLLSDDPDSLIFGDATDVVVGMPVPEPGGVLLPVGALLAIAGLRRRCLGRSSVASG